MRGPVFALLLAGAAACQQSPRTPEPGPSPIAAPLGTRPETPPASPAEPPLPVRGEGPPLPIAEKPLTRIALGCCGDPSGPLPIFAAIAEARPDLFLHLGDTAWTAPAAPLTGLSGLAQAYGELNLNAHFAAFNMGAPVLATWGRSESAAGEGAERVFETYWASAALGADHPGVHGSRIFGPPGRRVQVILLDAPGLTDAEGAQAQLRWLAAELSKPAELRLLAASAMDETAGARRDLLQAVRKAGSRGVLLVSGGSGAIHRRGADSRRPILELSAGPLSLPAPDAGHANSPSTPASFGLVEIDWTARKVTLSVRDLSGASLMSHVAPFPEARR